MSLTGCLSSRLDNRSKKRNQRHFNGGLEGRENWIVYKDALGNVVSEIKIDASVAGRRTGNAEP